ANSGSATLTVNAVYDTPHLTVMAPTPSGSTLTVNQVNPSLQVRAQIAGATITAVQYQLAGGAWTPMAAPSGAQPNWTATLSLQQAVPAGGRSQTLTIQGTSSAGTQSSASFTLVAIDQTPPVVTSYTPADGAQPPGTINGATVTVSATVSDVVGAALSSGVGGVTVRVDNGPPVSAQLQANGQWTAVVQVPAQDTHQLSVAATDAQGNVGIPVVHQVPGAGSPTFRGLSAQTYLAALLQFAWVRFLPGGGPAAGVNPFHLEEAFHQPFAAIAAAPEALAQQPVPVLRLVVQAL